MGRGMDIIVCIKEVPDPEVQAEKFTVDSIAKQMVPSPGVDWVISPFDENAIEAALQLKEVLRELFSQLQICQQEKQILFYLYQKKPLLEQQCLVDNFL